MNEAEVEKTRKPLSERLPEHLYSAIFQAIGQATMCWEHVDRAGIFDANQASEIAFELCHTVADELDKHRWKEL
jgi:hypothetical protein